MDNRVTAIAQRRPAWVTGLRLPAAGLALAALMALVPGSVEASSGRSVRVGASYSARLHETILVNSAGRTLYHLDTESARHIVCTGACARLWPPLLAGSATTQLLASHGVHGRLSLVRRPDGLAQVAFDGLPLYTFARDHRAADVNGQGFDGVWFVLAQLPARHVTASGIPQSNGGDMDGDNNGAPSDGDGNR